VKDKEISASDKKPVVEKEVSKKRHLNVVFIGHVGRLMHFMVFLYLKLLASGYILSFVMFIFEWLLILS
jgi:hypothetical protein